MIRSLLPLAFALATALPALARQGFEQPYHDLLRGETSPVIAVNLPARTLRLYLDGKLAFQCPCAIGRNEYPGITENSHTRCGSYRIETWATSYTTKEHPISWRRNQWQGAFGIHTALLGPDALYQHLHGTVGPLELGDWIISRTTPRDRRPDENERDYRRNLDNVEYGLSHGCVRVSNENITKLKALCPTGTRVYKIYCLVERYESRKPGDITERHFPNVYRYDDVDNGIFYADRGLLVRYHHPEDNYHLGPALPEPPDEDEIAMPAPTELQD